MVKAVASTTKNAPTRKNPQLLRFCHHSTTLVIAKTKPKSNRVTIDGASIINSSLIIFSPFCLPKRIMTQIRHDSQSAVRFCVCCSSLINSLSTY